MNHGPFRSSPVAGLLFAWLALCLPSQPTFAAPARQPATQPATEIRAVWIDVDYFKPSGTRQSPEAYEAWQRARVRDLVERLADAHFNLAWVGSVRTTRYATLWNDPEYTGRNSTYYLSTDDGYDVLGDLIRSLDAAAIEPHLYYSFTRYKHRTATPEYDPNSVSKGPAGVRGDPNNASVTLDEYERLKNDFDGPYDPRIPASSRIGAQALCNNAEPANAFNLDMIRALVARYPTLKGIHLEEPGYLSTERCVCHRCQRLWDEMYPEWKGRLNEFIQTEQANAFKHQGTDRFVKRLHEWLQAKRPDLILTSNGSSSAEWDLRRGRNW